jgi:hypothetical protein
MKILMSIRSVLAAISILIVTGCASSSNIQATGQASIESDLTIAEINVANSTGENFEGTDVIAMMRSAASDEVRKNGLRRYADSGTPYSLNINIIQYSKGNAVTRWMMPGAGKTILSVEAELKNPDGVVVAESQATESIGAGGLYTIGAWKRVFDKVAESLVGDIADLVGR